MADQSSDGGNGGLYFVVGGLVAVVGIGAWLFFGAPMGHSGGGSSTVERTTTTAPGPAQGSTTTTTTTKKTN